MRNCLLSLILLMAFAFNAQAAPLDLSTATIADLQAAMDKGTLTSEKLVQMYLKRIEAYDQQGPKLNAVLHLNPKALEEARALDAERKKKGRVRRCTASRSWPRMSSIPTTCPPRAATAISRA